tara:strand:- start:924 stop:4283 length:3360 start_codon:yes stop_codon:yes gene_type:complete
MSGSSRYEIDIVANNKASAALGRVDKQLKNIQGSSGRVNSSFDKMKVAAGLAAGAFAVFKTGQAFLNTAKQVENLGIQLKFITGSAELGAQALKTVEDAASRSAFSLESMANAAPLLLTVSSIDQLNDSLDMAGDIAAATGMSLEEAAGQLQRAFSGGIASADIFREKGVKSMLGFQEGVKYTAEETEKMIRDAFENGTTTIAGAAAEMAKTWDGQMSMMADSWFKFKKKTMDSGLFAAMKNALAAIRGVISDNQYAIDQFATALGEGLAVGINAIAKAIEFIGVHAEFFASVVKTLVTYKLATWLLTAAKAMRGLNLAFMLNPIGLVVGSIALLIGYLVGQNGLGRTIVQVQAVFEVLGDALSEFGKFLKEKLGEVVEWFTDKIKWMKDGLVNAYNAIAQFIPGLEQIEAGFEGADDGVGMFGKSLDYVKGKAGAFGTKMTELMPDGLQRTIEDINEAIVTSGNDYDKAADAAKKFADEQERLTNLATRETQLATQGPAGFVAAPTQAVAPIKAVEEASAAAAEAVKGFDERYKEFFSNTVKDAKLAADMIIFKQMAVKDLDAQLKAGSISIDTYAQSIVDLGIASKEIAAETDKTSEQIKAITESLFPAEAQIAKYKEQITFLDKQLALTNISEAEHLRLTKEITTQIAETSGATADLAEKNKLLEESLEASASRLKSITDTLFPAEAQLAKYKDQIAFLDEQLLLTNISEAEHLRLTKEIAKEIAITSGETAKAAEANRLLVESLSGYKDKIMLIAEANLKLKESNEEIATSLARLDSRLFPVQTKMNAITADLALAKAAFDNGSISIDEYNRRVVLLKKEMAALGPVLGEYPDRILRIAEATKRASDAKKTLADMMRSEYEELNPLVLKTREYEEDIKRVNEALKAGIITHARASEMLGQYAERFTETKDKVVKDLEEMEDKTKDYVDSFNKSFNDKLVDGLVEGNLNFSTFADMWKSTLKDLIKDTLNGGSLLKDILGGFGSGGAAGGGGFNLAGLFSGGGADGIGNLGGIGDFFGGIGGAISGIFSGFKADGGRIPGGTFGIAGEAGPEIITGPANVLSNKESFGNGGEKPQVNITIQAIDTQTGTEFLLKNRKSVEGIIQNAYNKRGKQGIY